MGDRLLVEELVDGRVAIALQREGVTHPDVGPATEFVSPLDADALEDLRWYLEDYLTAPFAVYEQRGQMIARKLKTWGVALFDTLFGSGKAGRDAYHKLGERGAEMKFISRSAGFAGLPWELIWDPSRAVPLALSAASLDRALISDQQPVPNPSGDDLRVLMVIARPEGLRDVGYQMIARPLIERLDSVPGKVQFEVLRPPTFAALQARLNAASEAAAPYHIIHFDGHGTFGDATEGPTGYLAFEATGGETSLISAETFAVSVNEGSVPVVVLNACKSGVVGQAAVEAAVATRLLEGGAASVVAMGYSLYATAAAEFMAAFYEALFAGKSVSEAVKVGRRRLYQEKKRPSPKGMLPLNDWVVPVHYSRRTVVFQALKRDQHADVDELKTILEEMPPSASVADKPSTLDALAPVGRFVGRDAAFYTLELALQWQRVALIYGPGGTGKTELAKAFGRWWQKSAGTDGIFFHSFEPGIASFDLDGVVTQVGLRLYGAEFVGKTNSADQRRQLILKALRARRLLLIWDNFESIYSLPDASAATPPIDADERKRVCEFLAEISRDGGRSSVIITSRTPEEWLGDVRAIPLGGLTPIEAAEMAENILRPYPVGRLRRNDRAFAELLAWLDGHPLSLRLLLPHLERVSAGVLLRSLKGETGELPPAFAGEDKQMSLGASLRYSFAHLDTEVRQRLPIIGMFEGAVDVDLLGNLNHSSAGLPARFAGADRSWWVLALERLASIGLLTKLSLGMYALHPALPAYLTAEWRNVAGPDFEKEYDAATRALLREYAVFADWLTTKIRSGGAEIAFALMEQQRRTMGRLMAVALAQSQYEELQSILQPLNSFWEYRGMIAEQRVWRDRCLTALEPLEGSLDIDSPAGMLWLYVRGEEANTALESNDADAAQPQLDLIRRHLESATGSSHDYELSVCYHQLGTAEQVRGNLDDAERWYFKALRIAGRVGDKVGVASKYHQLGVISQLKGKPVEAEKRYLRALAIETELGAEGSMASTYHQLGISAQQREDLDGAETWYLKAMRIVVAVENRPAIAATLHQLGRVAQLRGDIDGAEKLYLAALEIKETLGNPSSIGITYRYLGELALLRGNVDFAVDWVVRSVLPFPVYPHSGMGDAPRQLARFAAVLGMEPLEISWQRCAGASMPEQVRTAIERGAAKLIKDVNMNVNEQTEEK